MPRRLAGIPAVAAFCLLLISAVAAWADPTGQPVAPASVKPPSPSAPSVRVVVSIAPLRGLVEPLFGETGVPHTVDVLIPPGRSEHGYEIPPSKLAKLESADLVVLVGMGLEPQVEKFLAKLPPRTDRIRTVVIFSDAVGLKIDPDAAEHAEHHHEPGEECDHHHAADPHLWLDPVLVAKLVPVLTEAVATSVGSDPAAVASVRAAGDRLRKRVLEMHEAYALKCGQFTSKTIVVGHDAWGRLAERYGLETVAIAGLTASEPTPRALERAKATVQEKRLKAVFVEPQLSERAGRRIAESTGVEVRKLDPLGDGDWFAMMAANLGELERALGPCSAAGAGGDAKQPGKSDAPK
jgi:zinc transport system substrate-binding protein